MWHKENYGVILRRRICVEMELIMRINKMRLEATWGKIKQLEEDRRQFDFMPRTEQRRKKVKND